MEVNSLCKESPPPWKHGGLLGFKKSQTDVKLHIDMRLDKFPNSDNQRLRFLLETSFPGSFLPWYVKEEEVVLLMEPVMSCIAVHNSGSSLGLRPRSVDFLSTLENSKIPEDGAEFFVQFLNVLDARWSRLLSRAEKHIRKQVSVP